MWCIYCSLSPVLYLLIRPFLWPISHILSLPSIFQPVSVQWWEHDGPIQPGHMLRPHTHAYAGQPGPGVLPGPRQRNHQDHHYPPWDHLSWCQRTGWAHLWEVYGWRRLLVRNAVVLLWQNCPKMMSFCRCFMMRWFSFYCEWKKGMQPNLSS